MLDGHHVGHRERQSGLDQATRTPPPVADVDVGALDDLRIQLGVADLDPMKIAPAATPAVRVRAFAVPVICAS